MLDGIALRKELNQSDGIHPNAEGAKIMADNVYSVLKPML
jgi:acyl-CoA thioesterase-1